MGPDTVFAHSAKNGCLSPNFSLYLSVPEFLARQSVRMNTDKKGKEFIARDGGVIE
jgi:hypothetical protein